MTLQDEWKARMPEDCQRMPDYPLVKRTIDALDALEKRIKELEGALRPFAKHGTCTCWPWIHAGPGMMYTDPEFDRYEATNRAREVLK